VQHAGHAQSHRRMLRGLMLVLAVLGSAAVLVAGYGNTLFSRGVQDFTLTLGNSTDALVADLGSVVSESRAVAAAIRSSPLSRTGAVTAFQPRVDVRAAPGARLPSRLVPAQLDDFGDLSEVEDGLLGFANLMASGARSVEQTSDLVVSSALMVDTVRVVCLGALLSGSLLLTSLAIASAVFELRPPAKWFTRISPAPIFVSLLLFAAHVTVLMVLDDLCASIEGILGRLSTLIGGVGGDAVGGVSGGGASVAGDTALLLDCVVDRSVVPLSALIGGAGAVLETLRSSVQSLVDAGEALSTGFPAADDLFVLIDTTIDEFSRDAAAPPDGAPGTVPSGTSIADTGERGGEVIDETEEWRKDVDIWFNSQNGGAGTGGGGGGGGTPEKPAGTIAPSILTPPTAHPAIGGLLQPSVPPLPTGLTTPPPRPRRSSAWRRR
jgi:hypothetical protein